MAHGLNAYVHACESRVGELYGDGLGDNLLALDRLVRVNDLMVSRQQYLYAGAFCLPPDVQRRLQHFVLDERLTDGEALRLEKGVSHRAAYQELVDAARDERVDDGYLIRDLRAAEDSHKGMLRIIYHAAQVLQLLLHEETCGGLLDVPRDACGRSVCAMRRAEGVVDIEVAEARQLCCESVVVLLLLGVKAQVFEQQHAAVLQRFNPFFRLRPDAIRRKVHGLAQ